MTAICGDTKIMIARLTTQDHALDVVGIQLQKGMMPAWDIFQVLLPHVADMGLNVDIFYMIGNKREGVRINEDYKNTRPKSTRGL